MKRVCALIAMLCLCVSLCACHARVDLTVEPALPDELLDALPDADDGEEEIVGDMDEMAEWAWELYSAATEAEKTFKTYDLTYEGTSAMGGDPVKTRARIVRVDHGDDIELLIQTNDQQGYFKDGIGYFATVDERHWMPIDEEGFTEEMGFTESPTLPKAAFAEAIVIENDDGTRTVSCPVNGSQAAAYVADTLGVSKMGVKAEYVEESVTVDAEGVPISYSSRMKAVVGYVGNVSLESTVTYTAVGDAVTLTPPDDLDSYTQAK